MRIPPEFGNPANQSNPEFLQFLGKKIAIYIHLKYICSYYLKNAAYACTICTIYAGTVHICGT